MRSEAGFTLIELMIALVISSIVVYFLFSIQRNMTNAFEGQSGVSEVHRNVRSARDLMAKELRMAGYGVGQSGEVGVAPAVEADGTFAAVSVVNDAYGEGPDTVRVLYSDPSNRVSVTAINVNFTIATVDAAPSVSAGELVVLRGREESCLVSVTATGPNSVSFEATGAPFNQATNNHCDFVADSLSAGERVTVERARLRSFRIAPDLDGTGILQMSETGGLEDDWADLGYGFTNLQFASRYYEEGDATDRDGDGDPERDWYSGESQEEVDALGLRAPNAVMTEVSVGVEGRGTQGVQGGVPSSATPAFVDLDNREHNSIGDWGEECDGNAVNPCGIDLIDVESASRPPRYQNDHRYRSSRGSVDLRNLSIGAGT